MRQRCRLAGIYPTFSRGNPASGYSAALMLMLSDPAL